jgi:hypothetical protein
MSSLTQLVSTTTNPVGRLGAIVGLDCWEGVAVTEGDEAAEELVVAVG